jgi:hypothetical protein
MNKIKMTAGLLAFSAVGVHAAVYAPEAGSPQATKPWSISATLRGFYDDNYSTSPRAIERDSFGFEVSPSASLNLIRDQTAIGLSYVYSMRWYEDRENNSADHAHQVNAKLSHAFTPRYKLDVSDSFVVAQEPALFDDPGTPNATFLRSDGDNLRNTVLGSFSIGVTETTTVVLGYSNQYYDFDEEGLNSRSAFLDRVEHLGSINLRQVVLPKTVLVGGYQYEVVDYNSDDGIGNPLLILGGIPQVYSADERDSTAHYFYLGVDQGITATLNGSVRLGAQLTEYDFGSPLLAGLDEDRWSPYADANATWLYRAGSYAQLGIRHQRAQTDVGFVPDLAGGLVPNLDAESTTVYASVNHRIYGGFVASFVGQYQNSSYETEVTQDFSDDYFMAGINLTYEINKFLAAEAGYNYDRLDSELTGRGQPRSFTRNRVYVGIRGTY